MAHRTGKDGAIGKSIAPQAAYITLDGYAGRTKLTGTVDRVTHAQVRFTPDRDCYQFRAGVPKWVRSANVRYQYADITSVSKRSPE